MPELVVDLVQVLDEEIAPRGASPSSACTSTAAFGSTTRPFGVGRTVVFIMRGPYYRPARRTAFLTPVKYTFPYEISGSRRERRAGLATVLRHDVVRRRCGPARVGRDVPRLPRRGNQFLRHRRPVQPRPFRGNSRRAGTRRARKPGHRDEVLQPDRRRRQRARRLAPPREPRHRRELEAAGNRPRRDPLSAPLRRADASWGAHARARGRGARRQGAVPGRQQLCRLADAGGARHPGTLRLGAAASDPAHVQPREAPGGSRALANGGSQQAVRLSVQPGGGRPALRQVPREPDRPTDHEQDVPGATRKHGRPRPRRSLLPSAVNTISIR